MSHPSSEHRLTRPSPLGMRADHWESGAYFKRLAEFYEQELRRLRSGITENATDTVWCGPGETAVDAITIALDDQWETT
jgi:hypothetical protein